MHKFTDNDGREWSLLISSHEYEVLRDGSLKVDIVDAVTPETAQQFYATVIGDPRKFVRMLWQLVEQQALTRGVTPEQFGRSIYGDAFDSAEAAFTAALVGFFRKGQRETLAAALAKMKEVEGMAQARQLKILNDPKTAELIADRLDRAEAETMKRLEQMGTAST